MSIVHIIIMKPEEETDYRKMAGNYIDPSGAPKVNYDVLFNSPELTVKALRDRNTYFSILCDPLENGKIVASQLKDMPHIQSYYRNPNSSYYEHYIRSTVSKFKEIKIKAGHISTLHLHFILNPEERLKRNIKRSVMMYQTSRSHMFMNKFMISKEMIQSKEYDTFLSTNNIQVHKYIKENNNLEKQLEDQSNVFMPRRIKEITTEISANSLANVIDTIQKEKKVSNEIYAQAAELSLALTNLK